ncbi:MAG: hypothetical protein ACOY3D_07695, partial [Candidatus Omnitrophota bacterium]
MKIDRPTDEIRLWSIFNAMVLFLVFEVTQSISIYGHLFSLSYATFLMLSVALVGLSGITGAYLVSLFKKSGRLLWPQISKKSATLLLMSYLLVLIILSQALHYFSYEGVPVPRSIEATRDVISVVKEIVTYFVTLPLMLRWFGSEQSGDGRLSASSPATLKGISKLASSPEGRVEAMARPSAEASTSEGRRAASPAPPIAQQIERLRDRIVSKVSAIRQDYDPGQVETVVDPSIAGYKKDFFDPKKNTVVSLSAADILKFALKEYDIRASDGVFPAKTKDMLKELTERDFPEAEGYIDTDLGHFDECILTWLGRALGSCEFASHHGTEALKPGDIYLVGRDNGPKSQWMVYNIVKGLTETGVQVIDLGFVPSAVVYRMVARLGLAGGLYVTRSHVEVGTNGAKPIVGKSTLYGELLLQMGELIKQGQYRKADNPGRAIKDPATSRQVFNLYKLYLCQRYFEPLREFAAQYPQLKIGINFGGGSAGRLINLSRKLFGPTLFKVWRYKSDPYAKGGLPDPTRKEFYAKQIKYSKAHPDVIIFLFDLDTDRVGIIVNGELWLGDGMFIPIVDYVLSVNQGRDYPATFYIDSRSNKGLTYFIRALGGKVVSHPKGHSLVKKSMDLLMMKLAKAAGYLSAEEFVMAASFRQVQPEYSLHMFLTDELGCPCDDAFEFMLFWIVAYGKVIKHRHLGLSFKAYISHLEEQGLLTLWAQLKEVRFTMDEAYKKQIILDIAEVLKQYFKDKDFQFRWWEDEPGKETSLELVNLNGVFEFNLPGLQQMFAWSNTSEKMAIGTQAEESRLFKNLAIITFAIFIHARDKYLDKLSEKSRIIEDSKETVEFKSVMGVTSTKEAEDRIRAKYPDMPSALQALKQLSSASSPAAFNDLTTRGVEVLRPAVKGGAKARLSAEASTSEGRRAASLAGKVHSGCGKLLQQFSEVFRGNSRPFKDASKGAGLNWFGTVQRHNAAPAQILGVDKNNMAAFLAPVDESRFLQRSYHALAGGLGKGNICQAVTSISSNKTSDSGIGRLSSFRDSRNNSTASLALTRHSSMSSPCVAHPGKAGTDTEYPPLGSLSRIILNLFNIFFSLLYRIKYICAVKISQGEIGYSAA